MMHTSYLSRLKSEISVLPKLTQQQIISDFESYSKEATLFGKTETEIEREFGSPQDIALSYIKDEYSDELVGVRLYDKLLTELLSIVSLIVFFPLNIWLMSNGYYGSLPKGFDNPTAIMVKTLLTDPTFLVPVVVGIFIATRMLLTNKKRYRPLTKQYLRIEGILRFIPALLLAISYFTYHSHNRYLVIAILVQTTAVAIVYYLTRVLTTKYSHK